MKQAYICKAQEEITDGQLERIRQYTRRGLGREELFVFSLVLCDNEVDREGERFPVESLEKLAELYRGRTGVFDHAPRAENQAARIFDTAVERCAGECADGAELYQLRAWAYMARCEKNADLILEIDAGIKKEVSVGCAVESVRCSVCGADQRGGGCEHAKGRRYGDAVCHHLLVNPTDAYEWSFVAVPAQPRAGVTKRYPCGGAAPGPGGGLAPGSVAVDKAELDGLRKLAALGERRRDELRGRVVKLGLLGQPEIPPGVLEEIAGKLEVDELAALEKSFAARAGEKYPIAPQLWREETDKGAEAFSI